MKSAATATIAALLFDVAVTSAECSVDLDWPNLSCMSMSFEKSMWYDTYHGMLSAVGFTELSTTPFNNTSLGKDISADDWYVLEPHEDAEMKVDKYSAGDKEHVKYIAFGENVTVSMAAPKSDIVLTGNETFDELMDYLNDGGSGLLLLLKNKSTLTVRAKNDSSISYTAGPDPGTRWIAVGFRTAINVTLSNPQSNGIAIENVWDGEYGGPDWLGNFYYPRNALPVVAYAGEKYATAGRTCSNPFGVYQAAVSTRTGDTPETCIGYKFKGTVAEELMTKQPTLSPTPSPTSEATRGQWGTLSLLLATTAAFFLF